MKISFHLNIAEECASTNETLMSWRTREGFHGAALLAKKQTAGQGRRGRSWFSGDGNLALSVALRLDDSRIAALVPFTAAIALAEVLAALPGELPFRLKWPNDVYLKGKKFAGLLSQAKQQGNQIDLVLGIGANLKEVPDSLVPASALSEFGVDCSPEEFARTFLKQWEMVLLRLEDFSWVKEQWEKFAAIQGTKIFIVGEGTEYECVGLLPSGELQVARAGEVRNLSSEEISIRFV